MADIRIKDLTTTASSTASDDFIAVDGTTNGTRKLNAFSPTFGGNANVTGTAQAGGFHVAGNGATKPAGTDSYLASTATTSIPLYVSGFTGGGQSADILRVSLNSVSDWFAVKGNGQVACYATTASTTTSTGALVVGNGTSGGLGVGGSVNIHNNLTLGIASTGDGVLKIIRSSGGNEWLQIAGWSGGSLGNNAYSIDVVNGANARPFYFRRSTDAGSTYSTFLTWDTSNNATFSGTTASTSTSSGALVVSGGVGVAGAINAGGDITAPTTANITGGRFTSVNSNSYIEQSGSDFNYVTASTRPHVFSIGGTTRFQVTTSGIISLLPASAASLTVNSTMTFELTSNTSLKIFVRGSDGTTRSTTLTLA